MAALGPLLVGCILLAAAGVAKAWRPGDTGRAVAQAVRRPGGRRWPGDAVAIRAVRVGAVAEVAVAAAALVAPDPVTVGLVAVSYMGFAVFVLLVRRRGGPLATCGCFGGLDTPPSVLHAVVDLALGAGAAVAAWAHPRGDVVTMLARQPLHGAPLVALSGLAAWLAYGVMTRLGRLAALRALDPAPQAMA